MEISKIKLTQIEPADYNPRTITEEARKKLRNSIETFGLVEPIIINTKNNRIVSGHQRYDILLDMLMESDNLAEREFDYLVKDDYGYIFDFNQLQIKNEDYEKALNIVLNNTNLMGDYDYGKLGDLLNELEFNGFNLEFTGFDGLELSFYTDDELDFTNPFEYDDEEEEELEDYVDVEGERTNEQYVVSVSFRTKERANEFLEFLDAPYQLTQRSVGIHEDEINWESSDEL